MRAFSSLLAAVLLACSLWAAGIKLVMKDGSYQLVRSYERQGDRLRYYSLERDAWEEMPASLVDWKATEEANRREKEEALEKARQAAREAAAATAGLEVAPGVRLPDREGAYALAGGRIVELPTSQAGAKLDRGRLVTNVLLPLPVLKNRRLVTLPGAKAAARLSEPPQALYVVGRASPTSRFALLRVKTRGDERLLEAINIPIFSRKVSHSADQVQLAIESLPDATTRLTPKQPLAPGEYAIVEFLDDKLNLYVWDFGVGGS